MLETLGSLYVWAAAYFKLSHVIVSVCIPDQHVRIDDDLDTLSDSCYAGAIALIGSARTRMAAPLLKYSMSRTSQWL